MTREEIAIERERIAKRRKELAAQRAELDKAWEEFPMLMLKGILIAEFICVVTMVLVFGVLRR